MKESSPVSGTVGVVVLDPVAEERRDVAVVPLGRDPTRTSRFGVTRSLSMREVHVPRRFGEVVVGRFEGVHERGVPPG